MVNACLKWLKAFLVSEVRNVDFSIALIRVQILDFAFFDFLDLNKFLSLQPPPTTSLSLARSSLRAEFDGPIIFNIEVSGAAILLKP